MKLLLLLLTCLMLQGCASISVHEGDYMSCSVKEEPREDSPTPIFGGVVSDVQLIGHCLSAPVTAKSSDIIDWWEILLIPLPIVDLPLSLVVDCLYLPSDISYWPQWRQVQNERRLREHPPDPTRGDQI